MNHHLVRSFAHFRSAFERQSRRRRGLLAGALALLLAVVAFAVAPMGTAQAATTQTCSFANPGAGTYSKSLCVLDLSVVNPTLAGSPAGQDIRLEIPGGNYTIDYNLRTAGRPATPTTLPTYSGSFFGNRGFYTGIAGKPAYYTANQTTGSSPDASLIMSNVVVRDSAGTLVSEYALVGIDAEATDVNESISWEFDKPSRVLEDVGNACDSGLTGLGTTSVLCTSAKSAVRTGTAMIVADGATSMDVTVTSSRQQAASIAVLMSFAQLTKQVDSRIDPSDSFGVSISSPSGLVLSEDQTGTGATATTGSVAIASAPADGFTFAETSTATTVDGYTPDWACTRNGSVDPALPSGDAGTSASIVLGIGDFVDCTITNSAGSTGLMLQKHAGTPVDTNGNGIVDAGDTIPFSFSLTNSGELALDRIAVSDPLVGAVNCPAGALQPGATATCSAAADYVITAADAAAGSVTNTATASARPVGSTEAVVTSGTSSTETPVATAAPALTLTKTATPPAAPTAGSTVAYRFTVTNTGNVPIDGIAIDETTFTGAGPVPTAVCPNIGLAPGSSLECVATYTLTQQDVDAGGVQNIAVVTGDAAGVPVTSPSSQADVSLAAAPAIQLVKSSDLVDGSLVAGQTIGYTFVVTNVGNVSLSGITVDETEFTGAAAPGPITCEPGADSLAPGESGTCTMEYVATQTDVDTGVLLNTATASGTPPSGAAITSAPSTTQSPSVRAPALSVEKTVSPASAAAAGAEVTYSFLVTNTGNVTVHGVGVAEGAFSGTGAAPTVTCPAGTDVLLPGERVTCTAGYTVTQADIDAGQVTNTATGTGLDSEDTAVASEPSSAVLQADATPGLALLKTADPLTAEQAGETIAYTFLVTNVGTVSVSGVGIDEGDFSGTGAPVAVTCAGATTLAPGEQTSCTGSYTITQADVDAGRVDNAATATGTSAGGQPVVSPTSSVGVSIAADSSLTIVKSAVAGTPDVGETVSYRFQVTNTGNTTLTDVTVTEDAFSGSGPAPVVDCPAATLAPDETMTCAADYVITQADADRGQVQNEASATAQPPAGAPQVQAPPSSYVVAIAAGPSLGFTKTVEPQVVTTAGETLTYTYTVTNTGNVTMNGIVVTEGEFSGTGPTPVPVCPDGTVLAPGASVECHAEYTVTAADADEGWVTNTATGSALPPQGGAPVDSEPSTVAVTIPATPGLVLTKTASPATIAAAGEVVTYTFLVENVGNVTLTDVTVDEGDFSGTGTAPEPQCPDLSTLVAGASAICTAEYTATTADVDAGQLTNTATASGMPPGGERVSSEVSSADVEAPADPGLEVTLTVDDPDTVRQEGDVVRYTFVVTNTGNVTMHDVIVGPGPFSGSGPAPTIHCPDLSTLAPGESATCTAEYTVTAVDAEAGVLTFAATASGTPPAGGDPVAAESAPVEVPIGAAPGAEAPAATPEAGDPLADTGSNIAIGLLVLVGGLTALGVALVVLQRRRRRES